MLGRLVLPTVVLALAGGRLFAQVPPEERIPITDPDRLEALGFPRGATNVSVWSKADLGGGRPDVASSPGAPETWGTAVGYSSVFGHELRVGDQVVLDRTLLQTNCRLHAPRPRPRPICGFWFRTERRSRSSRSGGAIQAPRRDLDVQLFEQCQSNGAGGLSITLLSELATSLAPGDYYGVAELNDLTANNRLCGYSVRVTFAPADQDCALGNVQLRKLQVSWARQVSAAPAVPTFVDVPASHPFFQFVEALVKSGVTGGCGSGNYCPDAPLTRGQMAVFLSKALGLQWP